MDRVALYCKGHGGTVVLLNCVTSVFCLHCTQLHYTFAWLILNCTLKQTAYIA